MEIDNIGKVLVHDDEGPTEVHLINEPFGAADKTTCGEHLNSISTTHINNDRILVTCKVCKQHQFGNWVPRPESFDCGKCEYFGKAVSPCEMCKGIR